MSKIPAEPHPSAPRAPVETPHGTQLVIRSDPWEDAPLSEIMIRVAAAQGRLIWGVGVPITAREAADLFAELRDLSAHNGFHALSAWHAGLASHCRSGTHPTRYIADVIRRSRAHQSNARRGRPWLKQR